MITIKYTKIKDFKETLQEAFSYLEEINATPWLNFAKLWEERISFRFNHDVNFNLLLGLSANLKLEYKNK